MSVPDRGASTHCCSLLPLYGFCVIMGVSVSWTAIPLPPDTIAVIDPSSCASRPQATRNCAVMPIAPWRMPGTLGATCSQTGSVSGDHCFPRMCSTIGGQTWPICAFAACAAAMKYESRTSDGFGVYVGATVTAACESITRDSNSVCQPHGCESM